MKHYWTTLALAASLLGLSAAAPAGAQAIRIGTLNCEVSGGIGLIITSSKEMVCTFQGIGGTEYYRGVIRKYGIDIGITGRALLGWIVFAPSDYGPGVLQGTYVGGSADASLVIGGGANVLVGGLERSVTLQPVSVQAQTGVNVAAGVTSLQLWAR